LGTFGLFGMRVKETFVVYDAKGIDQKTKNIIFKCFEIGV